MPNIKGSDKRWRQSLKRRLRNRLVMTTTRTHIKTANRTIAGGEPDADALKRAVRALDKAAEKGIIHKNNAARRKSRLMHRFAVALAAPKVEAVAKPVRASRAKAGTAASARRATPRARTQPAS